MNNKKFTAQFAENDFTAIEKGLSDLEALCKDKLDSLTPAQRKSYGKAGNATLEWDERTSSYLKQHPELAPMYFKKDAFEANLALQKKVRPIINRLIVLKEQWEDTETLISFDVDADARSYYQNVKMLAAKNVPTAQTIYEDLSKRFANGGRKDKDKNEKTKEKTSPTTDVKK